ncbi:MAG TPA: DUF3089 domain-containing protein [Caulobacteraceae bacterium]|nr:DUF3089 domain-containing protein [Caulobacteraceae bacterium]
MALRGFKRWIFLGVVAFLALLAFAVWFYREDILQAALDPRQPYQVYDPPPAPNYASREAWALMPADPRQDGELAADVFFIHPTTYNGGEHWNAPIDDAGANETLTRRMLPNYAGPFVRVGRIFAPRYRQASLYTRLTMRDDAREARRFAYGDVREAFRVFVQRHNHGRPFVLVGVEQGGELAARLLAEEIAPNPELKARLVAAYLIDTALLAEDYAPGAAIPACSTRDQAGCVVAYASAVEGDSERERSILNRSLLWRGGGLEELAGRAPLCVNPITGAANASAPARENLGAANATDMEWGARPAFLQRQVGAQCVGGVLRVSRPKSESLRPSGDWAERLKAPGFNLFYADLEANALARVAALTTSASSSPNSSAGRSSPDR